MYRKVEDFLEDWREEADATAKLLEGLEEAKMNDKLSENVRSLGKLAWHMVQTLTEMGTKAELFETDELDHKDIPTSKAVLIDMYRKYAAALAESVEKNWFDATLLEMKNMYGEQWHKGRILSILIKHQTHHRGQMTVLMRLLGMPVKGVYGPAKEEWASFGMPTME